MKRALKRINKEYEDFRMEVLLLSKEEIFDMAYKINFYHEIWSFLNDTGRKIKSKMSLADLYDIKETPRPILTISFMVSLDST